MTEQLDQIWAILEEGLQPEGNQEPLIKESDEPVAEFKKAKNNIQENLHKIMQTGRVLRLGIVGEVKAGKSSFLNALLFEGEDVLPKAATPMTAALTKISYSEKPYARIVFYTQGDWDGIEANARRYDDEFEKAYQEYLTEWEELQQQQSAMAQIGDTVKSYAGKAKDFLTGSNREEESSAQDGGIVRRSASRTNAVAGEPQLSKQEFAVQFRERILARISPEIRACKEVRDMAWDQGTNIAMCLAEKEKEIPLTGNYRDSLRNMNDYVGAGGRYTPLVKYTEIHLNHPLLKDLEVVDTPGMNDPVLSRGRTTNDFLLQCDAVFLLSYCGQFLGKEDMEFMMNTLPKNGIRKAVLVGSKLDSAILQYPNRNVNFRVAYGGTTRNCTQQAQANVEACARTAGGSEVIGLLRNALPPILTSSMAFSAAVKMKKGIPLASDEEHLIRTIKNRFSDFPGDQKTLMGLSSIPDIRDGVFPQVRAEKDTLIRERIENLERSQRVSFLNQLEKIANQARRIRNDMEQYDKAQMQTQLADMRQCMDSVRVRVQNLFETAAVSVKSAMNDISLEIGDERGNHLSLDVATEHDTVHHSSKDGVWIFAKTTHWDEHVTTHTAQISDVSENIAKYINRCLHIINDNFKELLNTDKMGNQIKNLILPVFDASDRSFDEDKILGPVSTTLRSISIPNLILDDDEVKKYYNKLDEKMTGHASKNEVKNDDISTLKQVQGEILREVESDMIANARAQGDQLRDQLLIQGGTFIDGIINNLEENARRMEELVRNKEANLARYDAFIIRLQDAKKLLQEDTAHA